jgi:hypothetical protein
MISGVLKALRAKVDNLETQSYNNIGGFSEGGELPD